VVLQYVLNELHSWTSGMIGVLAGPDPTLDPAPSAPPGLAPIATRVIGWIKWVAITCIFALGFMGIMAMAAGRVTGNVDWSKYGQRGLLLGGFLAALFGVIFQVFQSLSTS
jgi:hypothetical protein